MSKKVHDIVNLLNQYRSTLRIPSFSVAMVEDENIIYSQGFGTPDVDEPYQRTTTDTLFSIQGITETFTASALVHLEAYSDFRLDLPVNHYLPTFKKDITTAHLLSHTSGFHFPYSLTPVFDDNVFPFIQHMPEYKKMFQTLPDLKELKKTLQSRESIVHYYATEELVTMPGEQFNHFSDGYIIAAHVLEVVSGMTWEEYITKYILSPLEMENTFVNLPSELTNRSVATYYMSGMGDPFSIPTPHNEIAAPVSGIYSTANDMSTYLKAQMNGHFFLPDGGLKKMHTPQAIMTDQLQYGLGWRMTELQGLKVVEQIGNCPGISCALLFVPDKQFGLVFLANTDMVKLHKLGYRIIKRWFG